MGALGLTNVLPVALALTASITLLSIGFGGTAQLLVQTAPPMPLRAGVVAIYTFAYYCVLPVGTATVGSLADSFGVTAVLLGMAGLTVLGAGVILAIDRSLLRIRPRSARRRDGAGCAGPGGDAVTQGRNRVRRVLRWQVICPASQWDRRADDANSARSTTSSLTSEPVEAERLSRPAPRRSGTRPRPRRRMVGAHDRPDRGRRLLRHGGRQHR